MFAVEKKIVFQFLREKGIRFSLFQSLIDIYLFPHFFFCLFNFWQSITFDRYSIEEGMNHYGFNTSMVSTNSSLKLNFTNTATFSGVHVTSIPLEINNYNELTIATGNVSINKYIYMFFYLNGKYIILFILSKIIII